MAKVNHTALDQVAHVLADNGVGHVAAVAIVDAYLDALGDAPYRSRPDAPYTADRVPLLDTAALEEAASAFPASGTPEDAAAAIISVYLAALPKPEKPARVNPADNPNRRQYVDFKTVDGRTEAYFCYADEFYGGATVPGPAFHYSPALTHTRHGIDLLCAVAHTASWNAGWYHDPKTGQPIERNVGEVIALMHSELSEALEGYRKGLMDDHLPNRLQIEVEFADTVIRIADTCGHLGLDLAGAIVDKMAYNRTREDHKREARANGGKSF